MGLSELTGLPRRKCKDVLQCKEVLKHRGTENTEEGGGRRDEGGVPCSGQSMAPLAQGTGEARTRETSAQLLVQRTILGRPPSKII